MNYIQPHIELWGLRINEPVTSITDLFVTVVCIYAFVKLNNIQTVSKTHIYLKYYFLSMGIATAVGGIIGHALIYQFSFAWKLPGWLTSMFSIALVERACIEYARKLVKPKVARFFAWLNIIELLTFMCISFVTLNFFFVEVHSAYGLLVIVSSFSLFVYYKTRSEGSKRFLIAVGISGVSALFFVNEIGISKWFNHYDISHILMTIAAYVFYLGSLKIIEEERKLQATNLSSA